mgnify:CR=1 FL=1
MLSTHHWRYLGVVPLWNFSGISQIFRKPHSIGYQVQKVQEVLKVECGSHQRKMIEQRIRGYNIPWSTIPQLQGKPRAKSIPHQRSWIFSNEEKLHIHYLLLNCDRTNLWVLKSEKGVTVKGPYSTANHTYQVSVRILCLLVDSMNFPF